MSRHDPEERKEMYQALCEEFEQSPQGIADTLKFRLGLARLGFNATTIEEEVRERRHDKDVGRT